MLSFFRRIQEGAILNLLVKIFSGFGLGFDTFFLHAHGVAFYQIIAIWAISPLVALPVVLFPSKWNVKRSLRLGLLTYTAMALSLFFFNPASFLFYGIFDGLKLGLFWVSFNYIFFLRSTKADNAENSSIYFTLGPLVGIILPPLAALVIGTLGYRVLFLFTAVLSLLPLLYVRGEYFEHKVTQSFREADKHFSGLRLITFFDAALYFFQGNFLTIWALLFLKTAYQFGGLLSFLAVTSLLASFIVSYASDKFGKRVEFLYPLLIAMGILIMAIPEIKSLALLIPIIGLYAVLDNLSMPLRFAIPMDMVQVDIGFWRASEFYGNVGRTIVFIIVSALLFLGSAPAAFAVFAFMTLAFPFIISWKLKKFRLPLPPLEVEPSSAT